MYQDGLFIRKCHRPPLWKEPEFSILRLYAQGGHLDIASPADPKWQTDYCLFSAYYLPTNVFLSAVPECYSLRMSTVKPGR